MRDDNVQSLILKIYDTALDPGNWPEVLFSVAHTLGAQGSMIFEMTDHFGRQTISSPYQSKNYDPEAVRAYIKKHNSQELLDQGKFAEISGQGEDISLVNDLEFGVTPKSLSEQSNVQDMMKFKLKHRSGAILNKDSWHIDRFSLQYADTRGPATGAEKALARVLLPHIAKALRIGRPIIGKGALPERFQKLPFGVCVISAKGFPIASNVEFDRIVDDAGIFKIVSNGQLVFTRDIDSEKYKSLSQDADEVHGQNGAYSRRQSIYVPAGLNDLGYFIEICPIKNNSEFGILPTNSRLITVLDTQNSRSIDAGLVARFFPLTESEKIVLELIGKGHTNREIAEIRFRSEETINSQVKSLLFKTYTKNRTELVQLALSLAAPFDMDMTGFALD